MINLRWSVSGNSSPGNPGNYLKCMVIAILRHPDSDIPTFFGGHDENPKTISKRWKLSCVIIWNHPAQLKHPFMNSKWMTIRLQHHLKLLHPNLPGNSEKCNTCHPNDSTPGSSFWTPHQGFPSLRKPASLDSLSQSYSKLYLMHEIW